MSRSLWFAVLAILVAGCSGAGSVPATGSPTAAPVASPTASATAASMSPPASAPPLAAFADDEPLLLYGHVTGAGGGVFAMRPDGTGRTRLATDALPGVHKRGDWSPDGRDVVFVDETTERLWIAHLDGRPSERLAVCEHGGCDYPSWSPDGRKVAYSRVESADGVIGPESVGIEVLDLATGSVSQVIRLHRPLLADVPRWSPDGTQLVIQVDRMDDEAFETGAALAIVPVAGGEPRYVTDFAAFASSPDWGWASDELAFSTELVEGAGPSARSDDDTWDLWRVRPDGTGVRRISHEPPGGRDEGASMDRRRQH